MNNDSVQDQESVSVPFPLHVCDNSGKIEGLLELSLQCTDVFLKEIGLDWICLTTTHVLQDILAVLHK